MRTPRRLGTVCLPVLMLFLSADIASAQIGGALRRAAGKVSEKVDVSKLLDGDPPITTSLTDAVFADESRDGFTPDSAARPLTELERTRAGGFVLQPGFFEMHTQSYCLKAGTHGPGGGDGYLYAPTQGPADEFVIDIVRSSVHHPDIAQRDIQVLLWAIIARTKFEDLPTPLKVTAAKLLNSRQLSLLNRNALDLVPGPALDQALDNVPSLVRLVLQAEAQLRQMLVDPASSFEQLEAVAVLAGMVGVGEGSRDVPSGRWSKHPDGYYVRYLPRGYSYTVVQVWVPEDSPAIGQAYDPALHIAVPGNTARQRLIQSGRAHTTEADN
jgi:hypothetical protein